MPISTHISQSLRQTGDVTVFCRRAVIIRKQTIIGSVSYRNRYWAYRRIGYFCMADTSLQVQQLLTSRITQDDQRAFVTRHSLRANAID